MYRFKIKQTICIIGLFLLGFTSQAQNNVDANNIYIQWQTSNCGINEEKALIDLLVANVSVMEPILRDGFRNGPPEKFVNTTASAELNRLRLNQKLIAEQKFETGLSKENLQIAASMNLDSVQKNIKRRIVNGWKTRALTGISYLNTKESIKLLERLAEDKSSPFNSLAKSLLEQNRE